MGLSMFIFFLFSIFFSFYSAKILSGPYLWNRYSQRLQIECAAWSCGLVVHCCLPSNSLCYFFSFFLFFATILSWPYLWNHYSQRLQIECAAWSCSLILLCCLPSNSLCFFFCFFSATILSGVEFFIFGGSLLGRIQGDREPVSLSLSLSLLLLAILVGDALWDCRRSFFFSFFFFFFPPRFCPANISGTVTHRVCCLVLRSSYALLLTIQFASLFFFSSFFAPRFCSGHISGTVTRRNSKLSVLLGPAV